MTKETRLKKFVIDTVSSVDVEGLDTVEDYLSILVTHVSDCSQSTAVLRKVLITMKVFIPEYYVEVLGRAIQRKC